MDLTGQPRLRRDQCGHVIDPLSVSNQVSGDDVTLSGSATLAARDVGSQSITSFAGLTLGGTSAGDYTLTAATGSVLITPLAVTLAGGRVYNGTTTANSSILSVSNAISGDTVSVASGSATLAGKDVGPEAISSFAGLTLGNNTAGDYTLTGATGLVTITPAALSIDAVSETEVYDGTTSSSQSPAYQVAGLGSNALYDGDTFTTLAQAFTSKDVLGTDGSTLAVSDTIHDGAGGGDYTVTTRDGEGHDHPGDADRLDHQRSDKDPTMARPPRRWPRPTSASRARTAARTHGDPDRGHVQQPERGVRDHGDRQPDGGRLHGGHRDAGE